MLSVDVLDRIAWRYASLPEITGERNPSRWKEWLDAVHEGGKKKVPNPNSETAGRFKTVSFSTALKYKPFFDKAVEEFRKWIEENPTKKPRKPYTRKNKPSASDEIPADKPYKGATSILKDQQDLQVGPIRVSVATSRRMTEQEMHDLWGGKDKIPTVEDFANMFGSWIDPKKHEAKMEVTGNYGTVKVSLTVQDKETHASVYVIRKFSKENGDLNVHHDLLRIEDSGAKGSGIGTNILRNSFAQYEKMGVKTVDQFCAWDGQYVWARMGYKMDDRSFQQKKNRLPHYIMRKVTEGGGYMSPSKEDAIEKNIAAWVDKNINSAQDLADLTLPNGQQIGKSYLLDSGGWEGSLNLDKSDPNYQRFRDYITGKKPKRKEFVDLSVEEPLGMDEAGGDWGDPVDQGDQDGK